MPPKFHVSLSQEGLWTVLEQVELMITSVEGGKLIKIKWVWGRRHSMGGGDERFSFIKLRNGSQ